MAATDEAIAKAERALCRRIRATPAGVLDRVGWDLQAMIRRAKIRRGLVADREWTAGRGGHRPERFGFEG